MKVVVADASPLNYLVQIGLVDLLPALYEHVFLPATVARELDHAGTPGVVRAWVRHAPPWLEVREVRSSPDPTLAGLDPGEREAIQLAEEEHADLLLMDERLGVRLARGRGLVVVGPLGVLAQAARCGLADIEVAIERLRSTDFRCTPQLYEHVIRSVRGR